jgi:hypothetical protein
MDKQFFQRHVAKTDATNAEFAIIGAASSAVAAAIVAAHRELRLLLLLHTQGFFCQADPRFYLE